MQCIGFSLDLMTAIFTKEEMQGYLAFITSAGKKEQHLLFFW